VQEYQVLAIWHRQSLFLPDRVLYISAFIRLALELMMQPICRPEFMFSCVRNRLLND